jgi:NADH:ubiquinone oxidoreductase subunit 3 (subunit A)
MSTILLLVPPIAFVVLLLLVVLHARGLSLLSTGHRSGPTPPGAARPYACGEELPEPHMQPDYAQFFPFAFFFTIMHVVALIAATVPRGSGVASGLAAALLVSAAVAVWVLFRR